jgi:hypothetical protein
MENPQHKDSWADLAGYAACGYEASLPESDEAKVRREQAYGKG